MLPYVLLLLLLEIRLQLDLQQLWLLLPLPLLLIFLQQLSLQQLLPPLPGGQLLVLVALTLVLYSLLPAPLLFLPT